MIAHSGGRFDTKNSEENFKQIAIAINSILMAVNGNLGLENVGAQVVSFKTPSSSSVEITIGHSLGRIPTYFIILRSDEFCNLKRGTSSWTGSSVSFYSSAESNVSVLLI